MKEYRWVFLMLLAAISIHIQESLYRLRYFDSFFSIKAQLYLQPTYYIAGWGLFWGFRKAQSFLSAWSVFIFFIVISRTIINFYVGEPWNLSVFLGLVLIIWGLALTTQTTNKSFLVWLGLMLLLLGLYALQSQSNWILPKITYSRWMLYLLISAVAIAIFENISRRAVFEKYFAWRTQRIVIPLNLITDCGLFYGYREAEPSFIFAWAIFTIYDTVIRIVNNKMLSEPFKLTHAIGMANIILGTALTYLGGST